MCCGIWETHSHLPLDGGSDFSLGQQKAVPFLALPWLLLAMYQTVHVFK